MIQMLLMRFDFDHLTAGQQLQGLYEQSVGPLRRPFNEYM